MGRRRWKDIKRARLAAQTSDDAVAYRRGYEQARRAFELGEQLRMLRGSQKLTQRQLAERARTSQSAIARLEAGGVEPKLDTLERIGAVLGVTLIVRFETPQELAPPTPVR